MFNSYSIFFISILLVSAVTGIYAQPTAREQLERDYGVRFSTPPPSGNAGFTAFRLPAGTNLPLSGNDPLEKASSFWATYGSLFNLVPQQALLLRQYVDSRGNTHLIYQQQLEVAVYGGEISLHFNSAGQLYAAAGFFVLAEQQWELANQGTPYPLPDLPTWQNDAEFGNAALNHFHKNYPGVGWQVVQQRPYLLPNALLGNTSNELQWVQQLRVDATFEDGRSYDLFLDASNGSLVLELPRHCDAIDRKLYESSVSVSNLLWEEGDNFPGSLSSSQQNLVRTTGETYNLFFHTFGRDSYDGEGGTMFAIENASGISCPNATSSGNTTRYCPGTTADDVIGHEWAHSYTGEINGLIYQWESGAINEGFSDVFGEVIDLLNTSGNDTNDETLRTACNENNNERWKVGEDATAFGGHIRDMYSPECKNDPSSRTADDFSCSSGDNGGVHINSGVLNRAFSLLTDGGTLNGVSVTGIGLTKATHVFHQAWVAYTTRVTDYDALGIGLQLASQDLIGQDLTNLTVLDAPPGMSGQVFTSADALQVDNAVAATMMLQDNNCNGNPALDPNSPANCPVIGEDFELIFSHNWEDGIEGFTSVETPTNPADWTPKSWTLNNLLPDGRNGQGIFIANDRVGDCNSDNENGYVDLISPTITIPAAATDVVANFDHWFSLENRWDGGLFYVSINGNTPVYVTAQHFLFNPYNRDLNGGGNDNPFPNTGSFTGSDDNSTSGSWGQSQVDLSSFGVESGDEIKLIWRMTYDGCNGWLGWYLDEISVGYCTPVSLPVDYLSFTARPQKSAIQLDWSTREETENIGFAILRRMEYEREFSEIGFIAASGNEQGSYTFVDNDVTPNQTYLYQLGQLDADGTINLSALVQARLDINTDVSVQAFPNPVRGETVRISWTDESMTKTIRLYDYRGKLLKRRSNLRSGETLTVEGLPSGLYFLSVGQTIKKLMIP